MGRRLKVTTLNKQVAAIKLELDLREKASNVEYCIGEYQTIYDKLEPLQNLFSIWLPLYSLLQLLPSDAPQKMEFPAEFNSLAEKSQAGLTLFIERWQKEKHLARQGDDLSITAESLQGLTQACKEVVETCWKEWIGYVHQMVDIDEARLDSIKNILGQESIRQEFIKYRSRLNELTSSYPKGKQDIDDIQHLKEKMVALRDQMKFDLPPEVADFFKELDRFSSKIPLSKLTLPVFTWLQEQGELDAFLLERKGKRRF